jgi:PAP2 superfamily
MKKIFVAVFMLFLFLSAGGSRLARADAVTDWNANAGKAAVAACISPADDPLHESRMYAMMHIAIHDAVNAIDRRSRPYAFNKKARDRTSVDAAVAAAARDVLVQLLNELPFPPECIANGVASVEADYTAALGAIADGPKKTEGLTIGQRAAKAILDLRAADGSDTPLQDFSYPQGTNPGEWRFTPDFPFPFAFAPGWGNVTPFVLRDSAQFRPDPPYALTSKKYAADFNEIKSLGGDGVTTQSARTAEQTEIGFFWIESSPLAWNRIARTVSAAKSLDAWENARLFGLLNMALADGYIGSWEAKYHYNFWRPITAIRMADTDGNPDTAGDPTWTPLQPTYPIPDYDSGHSVEGGAAAEVLKRFFGTDHIRFRACSLSLPLVEEQCGGASEVLRRYKSFSEAAEENGESRILIGIHFRKAVEEGIEHGRKIGARAVNRFLEPVKK